MAMKFSTTSFPTNQCEQYEQYEQYVMIRRPANISVGVGANRSIFYCNDNEYSLWQNATL